MRTFIKYSCALFSDWECPEGYLPVFGSNNGPGNVGNKTRADAVKTPHGCGDLCDFTENCQSFQWSPKEAKCLIFRQETPDRPFQRRDFQLCVMDLGTLESLSKVV